MQSFVNEFDFIIAYIYHTQIYYQNKKMFIFQDILVLTVDWDF